MTECHGQETTLPSTPRSTSHLVASPSPSVSPTGTASFTSDFSDDDDLDEETKRIRRLSSQERLLHSPTDKLLSPVTRALKTHRKRDPKLVRTPLTSLLDAI